MSLEVLEIEYETIARQSEKAVVFRIGGKEIEIDIETIIDFDLEGRLHLHKEDAVRFGLP